MPHRPEVKRAAALYRAFREADPRRTRRIAFDLPRAAAIMGTVEFIGYVTTHGGRTKLYIHEFAPGSRPYLAAGTRRNQALLVGGRYRVTGRGIVDLDRHGRAVHVRSRYKVEVV
jgi:hypothetical protein